MLEAPSTSPRLQLFSSVAAEVATAYLVCTSPLHQGKTQELLDVNILVLLHFLHATVLLKGDNLSSHTASQISLCSTDIFLLVLDSNFYARSIHHCVMIHGF